MLDKVQAPVNGVVTSAAGQSAETIEVAEANSSETRRVGINFILEAATSRSSLQCWKYYEMRVTCERMCRYSTNMYSTVHCTVLINTLE